MKHIVQLRIILACAISPSLPIILLYSIAILSTTPAKSLNELLLISLALSYAGFFLLGCPLIFILYLFKKLNLINLLISGFISGFIYYALLNFYYSSETFNNINLEKIIQIFAGSFFGVLVAFIFWLICEFRLK